MSLSWFTSNGGYVSKHLKSGIGLNGARGLLLSGKSRNTEILRCPPALILSIDNAMGVISTWSILRCTSKECRGKLDLLEWGPDDLLAVAMLLLCRQGSVIVPSVTLLELESLTSARQCVHVDDVALLELQELPSTFWEPRVKSQPVPSGEPEGRSAAADERRLEDTAKQMAPWLSQLPSISDMQQQAILAGTRAGNPRASICLEASMRPSSHGEHGPPAGPVATTASPGPGAGTGTSAASGAGAARVGSTVRCTVLEGAVAEAQRRSLADFVRVATALGLRAEDLPDLEGDEEADAGLKGGGATAEEATRRRVALVWLWAVACVRSRAVLRTGRRASAAGAGGSTPSYRGIDLALVPCMDLLNHADVFGPPSASSSGVEFGAGAVAGAAGTSPGASTQAGALGCIEVVGSWAHGAGPPSATTGGLAEDASSTFEAATEGTEEAGGGGNGGDDDDGGWLDDMLAGGLPEGTGSGGKQAPTSGDKDEEEEEEGGWLDDMLAGGLMGEEEDTPATTEAAGAVASASSPLDQVKYLADGWEAAVAAGPWYVCNAPALGTPALAGRDQESPSGKGERGVSAELCLSYGELSTADLLDTYGFIPWETRGWMEGVLPLAGAASDYTGAAEGAGGPSRGLAAADDLGRTVATQILPSTIGVHLPWETAAIELETGVQSEGDATGVSRRLGQVGVLTRIEACTKGDAVSASGLDKRDSQLVASLELPCFARDARLCAGLVREASGRARELQAGSGGAVAHTSRGTMDEDSAENDIDGRVSQSLEMASILAPLRVLVEANASDAGSSRAGSEDPYAVQDKATELRAWELLLAVSSGVLVHTADTASAVAASGSIEPDPSSAERQSLGTDLAIVRCKYGARAICCAGCLLIADFVISALQSGSGAIDLGSADAIARKLGWGFAEREEFDDYLKATLT